MKHVNPFTCTEVVSAKVSEKWMQTVFRDLKFFYLRFAQLTVCSSYGHKFSNFLFRPNVSYSQMFKQYKNNNYN